MATETQYSDMIANAILSIISYVTRIVFGDDKLNRWQLLAFLLCCGAWVWIISLIDVSKPLASGLSLTGGLVIPSIIKGIIKGSKSAEGGIAKNTKDKLEGFGKSDKNEK